MTPDSWERRPLPCQPGYNYCSPVGPQFTVVYDPQADMLTITANVAVFGGLEQINYEGSAGNGAITNFVPGDPQTVYIMNAAAALNAPTTLTHLDFFGAGPTLLGIWTGSVVIPQLNTATYPLLTGIASPGPNQIQFIGQRFLTGTAGAASGGYVRLASYATGCFDGGDLYVQFDAPDSDWIVVELTDTSIIVENPRFSSCVPDDARPLFYATGLSLDAPGPNGGYGTPPGDGYYFYEPWGDLPEQQINGAVPCPNFTVNVGGDTLQIFADAPFFIQAGIVSLGFQGPGSFSSGANNLVPVDDTHLNVENAHFNLDGPREITQIQFADEDFNIICTWTGSVNIP